MREGNYGWLERIAFFSFLFAIAGMAVAVMAWKTFDEPALVGWLLGMWFAPLAVCVLCWWAVFAKDEFGGLCQAIAIFCGLGLLTGEPASLLGIPILIGMSWVLSHFDNHARAMLNFGRSRYRKV